MYKLFLFNTILLAIIFIGLFILKKYIKTKKAQDVTLLISSIITILCHYSSFIILCFSNGDYLNYLKENPNLILPIYPCNVVMWGCLIYGLLINKESKVSKFLADYLFFFGIFSTLVGMFANVDFINNPTFKDYEITKSVLAHATLLFNVLLIFIFKHIKIDLIRNMLHIFISVILMYVIGLYCNTLFKVLVSNEMAESVNSMFILHSPFEGVKFLRYPFIAGCSLLLYFGLFSLLEVLYYKKENRWFNRIKRK